MALRNVVSMRFLTVLILSFAIVACSEKNDLPYGSDALPFSSQKWKAKTSATDYDDDFITTRQKMLGDVVENILPGKTNLEVELLLGESLDVQYGDTTRDIVYYMGAERGSYFKIDSEWLLIWFDENGLFERYVLHTD